MFKKKLPQIARGSAICDIVEELQRAQSKFPEWPTDPVHAAAIVAEEAGELVRASLRVTYENADLSELTEEAVQTGAMALRFLINQHRLVPDSSSMKKEQKLKDHLINLRCKIIFILYVYWEDTMWSWKQFWKK